LGLEIIRWRRDRYRDAIVASFAKTLRIVAPSVMLKAPEQPERSRHRPWLRWIAFGVEVAGVIVLIVLYQQVLDYRRTMGCGEQCAWKAMGLMAILYIGGYVIVPGALAALYLGRQAYLHWRQDDGLMATMILHAVPLVMLLGLVALVVVPPRAKTVAPITVAPPSNADQELAGYVWASDTVIMTEQDCIKGTTPFIEGCKRYARRHSAAP
jgi:hypothetical protein